jgi:hypothetical protein
MTGDKQQLSKSELLEIARKWQEKLNVKPKQITIRKMKSKWGSLSSKGRIILNSDLTKLPTELADYAVLHEMLHFMVPNHDKKFKALLSSYMSNWEELSKALNSFNEDKWYLVEVYGSLLNSNERMKTLSEGGKMEEVGDLERVGWKLSFDRYSKELQEAVLNLVESKSPNDIYYTKVYRVDRKGFDSIMNREMGKKTAEKWRIKRKLPFNSYRPVKLSSEFGKTTIFLIPERERLPTPTINETDYVKTVREGIRESFKCSPDKREANLRMLTSAVEQSQLEEIALHNIVDMGLTFSAMMRLFDEGSKQTLRNEMIVHIKKVFQAKSEEEFDNIHNGFCEWGAENILQAKTSKGEKPLASYGQIAKTFDVVLKVTIYYCQLPNIQKAQKIIEWLNAAVDTKMMAFLKRLYRDETKGWPKTVKKVDKSTYTGIQRVVEKFIKDHYNNKIRAVHFDDIYWKELNRKEVML